QSGAAGVASGLGGVARAAGGAAASPLRRAAQSVRSSFADGVKSGFGATGGSSSMRTVANDAGSAAPAATGSAASPPAWAQRMRRGQTMSHGVTLAAHAIRSGDSHGGGSSINLSGGDRT
ncbi:MAG: P-type conjugative transfer protein TrbL, partial [Reyranella sp.]